MEATNANSHNDDDDTYWTIQIKSVGDQRDFSVMLHPEDDLAQLYDEIHCVTGLPREQQRLIYRGRLLGKAAEENEDRRQQQIKMKDIVGLMDGHTIHLMKKGREPFQEAPVAEEVASTESPSLDSATNNSNTSSSSTSSLLASLLGAGERNHRRTPFRLREEDLQIPDPGSMESVRQGLMTMRTMATPRRAFFIGQWLDCRDTVNQWLEATVVDVVSPRDILRDSSRPSLRHPTSTTTATTRPTYDPAVGVTDLDGRRLLLLESCDESDAEEQINGTYYRRRSNDDEVQILHIHYNGWPVRWDEWIRSDSERIRPFRVRTRHPTSGRWQSPTVQAPMQNPPNTMLTENESTDREAVLPELLEALRSVEGMLEQAASQARSHDTRTIHLPWSANESAPSDASRHSRQRHLRALAPALDRLGRILTDSAPHIAALAASLEEPEHYYHQGDDEQHLETIEEHPSTLGGLLSLLSRDRRPRRTSQSISSSLAVPSNDVSVSVASSTTGENEPTTHEEDEEDAEEEVIDPDLSDYTYGSIVNTTRGEVRTGPRASRSPGDDVAGLLGAYFAAASMGGSITATGQGNQGPEGLGRLLRERGNGGIDIHIHAIVTSPDMEGGIGIATANGPAMQIPTASVVPISNEGTSLRFGRTPQRREPQALELADDDGIFSELYSENPEPVNPNNINQIDVGTWDEETTSVQDSSQASRGDSSSPRRISNRNSSRRNGVLGRFFRRGPDGE